MTTPQPKKQLKSAAERARRTTYFRASKPESKKLQLAPFWLPAGKRPPRPVPDQDSSSEEDVSLEREPSLEGTPPGRTPTTRASSRRRPTRPIYQPKQRGRVAVKQEPEYWTLSEPEQQPEYWTLSEPEPGTDQNQGFVLQNFGSEYQPLVFPGSSSSFRLVPPLILSDSDHNSDSKVETENSDSDKDSVIWKSDFETYNLDTLFIEESDDNLYLDNLFENNMADAGNAGNGAGGGGEDPPPPPPQDPITVAHMRALLRQALGDFGHVQNEQGNLVPGRTLQQQLEEQRRRGDVQKPPGPDIFRGTSAENARMWKQKMEDYMELQGVQDDQAKMRVVRMYLGDSAQVWYRGLEENTRNSWELFSTAFDNAYMGAEVFYADQQSLASRKQKFAEDPHTFAEDVILRGNKVGWGEERIVQHIIAGLKDRLKQFVLMQRPVTLQQCRTALTTAQAATDGANSELADIQLLLKDLKTEIKADKNQKVASVQPYQSYESYVPQANPQPNTCTALVPYQAPSTQQLQVAQPTMCALQPMQPVQPAAGNPPRGKGFKRGRGQNRSNGRNDSAKQMVPNIIIQNGFRPRGRGGFRRGRGGYQRGGGYQQNYQGGYQQNFQGGYQPNYQNSYQQNQGNFQQNLGCYQCGAGDHFVANCPRAVCYNCNQEGHVKNSCPSGNQFQRRMLPAIQNTPTLQGN